MIETDLFAHHSYRPYLLAVFGGEGRRTGVRTRAAQAMGCQLAYVSQVLKGSAELSIEQAFRLTKFLNHGPDEREMFLLLVQRERAGEADLKAHFEAQIQALLERRLLIKNRLQAKEALGADDQSRYYSSWLFGCLHVIVTVPGLRTLDAIAAYLNETPEEVGEALDFLESRGLVAKSEDGLYKIGPRHVHLPESSPNILKHHANWRLRALRSLERKAKPSEVHYSVVGTISRKDAALIKERILKLIQENMKTFAPSPEEAVYCNVIDWFEIP